MHYRTKFETTVITLENKVIHTQIFDNHTLHAVSDLYEYYETNELANYKLKELKEIMDIIYKKET